MKTEKIRDLLRKYYHGETSLEEENQLRHYFLYHDDVPGDLSGDKLLFEYYDSGIHDEVPEGFMDRIEVTIDQTEKQFLVVKKRKIIVQTLTVAAGILLLAGLFLLVYPDREKHLSSTGTFDNPELAYEETKKVLLYVSRQMNKGTEGLNNISKLNTATEPLKNINKLENGFEVLNELLNTDNQEEN